MCALLIILTLHLVIISAPVLISRFFAVVVVVWAVVLTLVLVRVVLAVVEASDV